MSSLNEQQDSECDEDKNYGEYNANSRTGIEERACPTWPSASINDVNDEKKWVLLTRLSQLGKLIQCHLEEDTAPLLGSPLSNS